MPILLLISGICYLVALAVVFRLFAQVRRQLHAERRRDRAGRLIQATRRPHFQPKP